MAILNCSHLACGHKGLFGAAHAPQVVAARAPVNAPRAPVNAPRAAGHAHPMIIGDAGTWSLDCPCG
jgi:hypothetical protein